MKLREFLNMEPDRGFDELVDLRALDYVSSYDEHLMCPICHCPFIRPVRLQCDHVFCQTCLNSAIAAYDAGPEDFTCPTCRVPARDVFMNVPRLLINMCDDIRVRCPFSGEGCKEIVPRGHVQSHVDKYCEYKLVACPSLSCDKKTRKKNLSPDNRCMHSLHRCDGCGEDVMEQDLEEHVNELCPSLTTTCPDCQASIIRNSLKEHIDSCPEAIHPCAASKYGCPAEFKRAELSTHEQSCPLVALGPYFEAQNARLDAMDMTIRHLKQRNEILEDGLANIRATLLEASRTLPDAEARDGRSSPERETRDRSRSRSSSRSRRASNGHSRSRSGIDRSSISSSTATTYLLSLHESLREEVSQLSLAITDLDARASMALMNESLRIKEDMAHTNAALNSVRMQVHWLMNPRLHHQGQRTTSTTATTTTTSGVGSSSAAAASHHQTRSVPGLGSSSSSSSRSSSAAAGPAAVPPDALRTRRLSDSTREGTKL